MTRLEIHSGACGYSVIVVAVGRVDKKIKIAIETDCEQVKGIAVHFENLTIDDIFRFPFGENRVYQAARKMALHASCPVPCGIIKATECELGLAVKGDAHLCFINEVHE